MKNKSKFLIKLVLLELLKFSVQQSCVNIWDADSSNFDINLCPVSTDIGEICSFPFTHSGTQYRSCALNLSGNPQKLPQCVTQSGKIANCIVPTDAIVTQVTTRKAGNSINGVSLNGGTLVWISGRRFAPNTFSVLPSAETSNEVFITSSTASYPCEIHTDKVTTTQITCYTPALPSGTYLIRVKVRGELVPLYQYENINNANIIASIQNTPTINSISPMSGLPGTLLTIEGDFKTECYSRDIDECADDSGSRITRVFFGGQICDLINPDTNDYYDILTRYKMTCKLTGFEVDVYNATILVSEQYGRSLASRNSYLISRDEKFYNFRSFADIKSISPSVGSLAGGTDLTIKGSFLFHRESFPALIEIGGTPCNVISFDGQDRLSSTLVCKTSPKPNTQPVDYLGGRGITLIRENLFTQPNNLKTIVPNSNSPLVYLDQARFTDFGNSDVTVWLKGYLSPAKSSNYKFEIKSNSHTVFYISDDQTSQNKKILIDYDLTNQTNFKDKYLESGKNYYIEAVSSRQNGKLDLSINAIMLDTFLTDTVSNLVSNEMQELEITSDIDLEKVEIVYGQAPSTEGVSEIQEIVVNSSFRAPFRLSFDNALTSVINFDSLPQLVEKALNDLPSLGDQYTNVTEIDSQDPNVRIFRVIFSPLLGDVPLIEAGVDYETLNVTEIQNGSSNGKHIQLMIENTPTPLFDVEDSQQKISAAIDQFFGIRCPVSILRTDANVHSLFDFENQCNDDPRPVNQTAFCGRCGMTTNAIVLNPNSLMTFQYVCFAYLTSRSFNNLVIQVEFNSEIRQASASVNIIADSQWHFTCLDIHLSNFDSIPKSRAILRTIRSPFSILIDAVTIRRTIPFGLDGQSLITNRRIFPALQIYSSTLKVEKIGNDTISIAYRTNNCSHNLQPIIIRQKSDSLALTKKNDASPPVTGDFSLSWNNLDLPSIPADADENTMRNYLESLKDFGSVNIERSKDCSGYKWGIKWINGGDKAQLKITNSNLNGTNPQINAKVLQDGGARFYPLVDDILRTHNSKPQVSVTINGVTSRCSDDCKFEWENSATPQVVSIDISNRTSIVFEGSGFDEEPSNNIVLIGQVGCTVKSATTQNLICEPGNGPVGSFDITVNVIGKGLAKMNTDIKYEFELIVTDFNPKISGVGGGITINITGSGFSGQTQVTIDSRPCKLISNTYNTLSCIVPSNPSADEDIEVEVVVIESNQNKILPSKLKYQFIGIPIVNDISPSVLSVLGNENIIINGINLPNPLFTIRIGTARVKVLSSNSTHIRILSPALNPGLYDLVISTGNLGNVLVTKQLEYRLYISSIKPNIGSIRGGSMITIKGDGFSTECSKNKVSFGFYECDIKSCNNSEIKCLTGNAQTNHLITNDGFHNRFGFRYEWDRTYLIVNKSDWVTWSWQPPVTITGLKFKVEQVQGPNSIGPISNGFSSGEPSEYGSFKYQFHQPGIYHYWSGFVDVNQRIFFRGVIEVQDETNLNKEFEIDLKLNEITAQKCSFPFTYNGVERNDCVDEDGSKWCSPTPVFNGQKLECIDDSAPDQCSSSEFDQSACDHANVAKYSVKFTDCQLPRISDVSPLNVNFDTVITVTGTGFSANDCENEVYIGGKKCEIEASSENSISCKIGSNSNLLSNRLYGIEVMKKNVGYALHNKFYEINFQSNVQSITPQVGSTTGGTKVAINGGGFTQDTYVVIGHNVYTRHTATIEFNSIILITREESEGSQDIVVFSNNKPAICHDNCSFTFNSETVPTIDSVSPTTVNQTTDLTIIGQNFVDDNDKSLIKVKVGNQYCQVTSSNLTQIDCTLDGLDIGAQNININIETLGNSISPNNVQVTGIGAINSISPTSGSIHGGTKVKILGNGFINQTVVQFGSSFCKIESAKINELVCITSAHSPQESVSLNIRTNNIAHSNINNVVFSYQNEQTPNILSVSPTSVSNENTEITISGNGFSSERDKVHVTIGSSECSIVSASETEIKCNSVGNNAGSYPINLLIDPKGLADKTKFINYELTLNSLSSAKSGVAGGLLLTIDGFGFSNNTQVNICNKLCPIQSWTISQLKCIVPKTDNINSDSSCKLVVIENGKQVEKDFNYEKSITPSLSSVLPLRGGTGGGTVLTIQGLNFPNENLKVTISGTECLIKSVSSTKIECYTGSFTQSSVKALIELYVDEVGLALNDDVYFEYIDLWSSRFTWGGDEPPGEGELVIIGESQTVYFDTETPILKGIIIIGGALIFDDSQDVHLRAEYIIIAGNGRLQIGSEAKPFTHKAIITMFGSVMSLELPIFGSKVIALREGTIEMHGMPVGVTWTQLETTSLAGSSEITVKDSVIWQVGSEIVIASTGNYLSQGQNEVRKITSVSNNGKTLTLDRALNFDHFSVVRTVGSGNNIRQLEIRAEVGLLTRNVVFQGNNDESWTMLKSAKACPNGFNPGEFAVQTCFLGRYGDELGSNEFGATIMVHADPLKQISKQTVFLKMSNIELFHVGQAFRLGRYPIHFHLNYEMPQSYVKECVIHQSFNRAVNIHGTNYVTVERNFIYNILGGAYFLEDGIEIGNVFKYNLAIFVKTSSSLLNEDVTPAAFWVTNPNNTYMHNSVAGGTHFGWWYRILDRPDGPSFRPNYCPKKIPLGKFFNNTVHGVGRFGLWIFPGYTPTVTGGCNDQTPSLAKFEHLTAYSSDKGAEWVMSNSIQFSNFVSFDHHDVGIETKSIASHQTVHSSLRDTFFNEQRGTAILNSIIVGNSDSSATVSKTRSGLVIAWERGLLIRNVSFYNFPNSNSHAIRPTEIIGTCPFGCGGWTTKFSNLLFENVKHRTLHRWNWDFVGHDLDGSLSGVQNGYVVSTTNTTLSNSQCEQKEIFLSGSVCSSKNWIRFSFNSVINSNFQSRVNFTNSKGSTDSIEYIAKRLTHPKGYTIALEVNQEYLMEFTGALSPINLTYVGTFFNLYPNQYIIIKHQLKSKPDRVLFGNSLSSVESITPINGNNNNGNWHWENSTSTLTYIISNKEGRTPFLDVPVQFNAFKCRFLNCEPPVNPSSRLPVTERPANAIFWSEISDWVLNDPEWTIQVRSKRNGARRSLLENKPNIKIPDGRYVVVDSPMPIMKSLQIDGILELDNGIDHRLEADVIFINGGQLIIGWENDPILTKVEIVLNGQRNSLDYKLPNFVDSIGGKAIGVYGGLDIHGRPRQPSWTTLNSTVTQGSNTITLKDPVDWNIGEQILITTTSHVVNETEVVTIASKSNDNKTLTLSSSLNFEHLAFDEQFSNSVSYSIAAGVGLLSRNVKVIGAKYAKQDSDLYGFKVIVSDYSTMGTDGPVYFKGFARLSNAQFEQNGQFSRLGGEEYGYGVLFSNLGAYNYSRPSYIRNCAFSNGFSTAVGVLGSSSIPISGNVIYRTVDSGIYLTDHSNIIRNNLIVSNFWVATLRPWTFFSEKEFYASVHIRDARSAVVENNLIAGSERIGLYYRGDACIGESFTPNQNHSIKNNRIYSAMSAVVIMPKFVFQFLNCIRISGFTVYKSAHWGIYYQALHTLHVDSNILVDNQINLFTQVIEPSILAKQMSSKKIFIRNNLIVGHSPAFNCSDGVEKIENLFYSRVGSMEKYNAGINLKSKVGITWSQFLSGSNGAPFKPWAGIMTYNALDGLMVVDNVTFAHFGIKCNGQRDYAISSNEKNDDGQHPMDLSNIQLHDVDNSSKVWIHRPNINKINPSDCVDMDCDGLKKNLLTDKDGSFLGQIGTVISQSEFEWGSQRRGLGDFRIPKEALAAPNGSMLPISEVYSHLGIVRDEDKCSFITEWQAYQCFNLEHKVLTIESMDHDTEIRRISPVAIISDNKYLDLINGPQDHGWCFGYTCQQRVSSFMAIVVNQRSFDIYLSSTPPKQLRFRILNADQNFKIRLSVHYFSSNRIDVFKNEQFINPTNGKNENGKFTTIDYSNDLDSFMPKLSDQSGTNLAVREHRKVYAIMSGADYLDFRMTAVLFLRFGIPAITEQDFFKPENLIRNFADLFGIDPSRIRRVNIIGESRRKRQIEEIKFIELIIFENPSESSSLTPEDEQLEENLKELYTNITNQFTTGELQQMAATRFNVTLSSLQAEKPQSNSTNEIKKIDKLKIVRDAGNCREQSPCLIQPILTVLDESNRTVTGLESLTNPWKIRAKVVSSTNENAGIIFETEAHLRNDGFVQFSKLGLSQATNSFRLEFELIAPAGVSNINVPTVKQAAISCGQAVLDLKHLDENLIVDINQEFNLTVSVIDKFSHKLVNNISWRNHEWRASARLYNLPTANRPNGVLNSSSNLVEINLETSSIKILNLFVNSPGMYVIEVIINSVGNEYFLIKKSNVIIVKLPEQDITLSDLEPPILFLKFNRDITQNVDMIEVYKATIYNGLIAKHNLILTRSISIYDNYMANFAFSLNSDPGSLIDELNNGFILANGIALVEATFNDIKVDVRTLIDGNDNNSGGENGGGGGGASSDSNNLKMKNIMMIMTFAINVLILLKDKF